MIGFLPKSIVSFILIDGVLRVLFSTEKISLLNEGNRSLIRRRIFSDMEIGSIHNCPQSYMYNLSKVIWTLFCANGFLVCLEVRSACSNPKQNPNPFLLIMQYWPLASQMHENVQIVRLTSSNTFRISSSGRTAKPHTHARWGLPRKEANLED